MSEIALFEQKEIRRVWQNEEWYFSVLDVVKALTDSTDPKQYIKKMRARDPELSNNWGTICTPVQMIAADGKQRKVQAANSHGNQFCARRQRSILGSSKESNISLDRGRLEAVLDLYCLIIPKANLRSRFIFS